MVMEDIDWEYHLDTETAEFKATWLVEDQASGSSPKQETLEDGRRLTIHRSHHFPHFFMTIKWGLIPRLKVYPTFSAS